MKYWEIIANNLRKAGWSWGCVSAIDMQGRTIWIADAHRGDGKSFVVRANEKLAAFIELEAVTHDHLQQQNKGYVRTAKTLASLTTKKGNQTCQSKNVTVDHIEAAAPWKMWRARV